jgi:predicted lactoylglutathione lyase
MPQQIFVNLPVKDLKKSMDFFEKLGFTFNPQFTDEKAACLVISDAIYAMLVTEPFFKKFTKKKVADAKKETEALVTLSMESDADVDAIVDKAEAAGAEPTEMPSETQVEGMHGRGFQDLDGHQWEFIHMDLSAMPANPS